MATVAFERQSNVISGDVYKAVGLATGDETGVLPINGGESEVTVHIYGTVGGSTVAVQGSIAGTQFNTLDDAYGVTMSYTAVGVVKPVGPAVSKLKVAVTGGSSVAVTVDVYIVRKVRP